jgi:glycosyltransferase involved in cell wall biosynthesis
LQFLALMDCKKISIIIPAFNEEKTILALLGKVIDVGLVNGIEKEILVVDDCSIDKTCALVDEVIQQHPQVEIRLLKQMFNQGKGAALHTGIANASGDLIVIQDADLEYDPNDYNVLLQPFVEGHADVVYGSRFLGGQPHRILFFWHSIGNKFLTSFSNVFTNLNLTDMETCYKMFRADILKSLQLKEKRFGFEPEVTAKMSRIPQIRIYEVGISYYGRTYEDGKKIGASDGFRAIWCILKYNLFSK